MRLTTCRCRRAIASSASRGQESPAGHGWLATASPFSTPGREQTDSPTGRTQHANTMSHTNQTYWVSFQLSALCSSNLWVLWCEGMTNHVGHSWGMTGWLDIDVSSVYCSTCETGSSWRGIPSGALSCCRSTARLSLRWKACIIKREHDC